MGSGKTVVGALVAERVRAPFADLDALVENEAGISIAELFATEGEPAFRSLESRLLPQALRPGTVAALGGGATLSDVNWKLIRERAVSVYLEVPFDTLWDRIAGAAHRPLVAGRTRSELVALLDRRRPRYEQADHRVDGDRGPDKVADEVLKLWSG